MRILHVIHSLDARSGGPSHAIRHLARSQALAGHTVSVLASTAQSAEPWAPRSEYADSIAKETDLQRVEVILARSYGRRRPWSRFSYSPSAKRWLVNRCQDRNLRPDIVHIHGIFSHVTSLAASCARSSGIPYIVRPTGALDPTCYDSGRKRLKQLFTRLILGQDLRNAAYIHTTSAAEAEAVQPWATPQQIRVIPLGVDVPEFTRHSAAAPLLDRHPILKNRRVVLFLSRLAAKKRPQLLVEAFALVASEMPDLLLVMAGQDAGALKDIEASVTRHSLADRVVMVGFLRGAEKRAAFAISDVFALPSIDENFGVAVVEAMAHGVPILVTPGVASHTYVDESGCGLTVEATAADLANGMRQLLSGDRQEMGQRGRQFVGRHLTWPAVIGQLDSMYQQAIGTAPQLRAPPSPAGARVLDAAEPTVSSAIPCRHQ